MSDRDAATPPEATPARLRVGVLASQGDFAAHARMLRRARCRRRSRFAPPRSFDRLDALVIPGGESTTISKAIERDRLAAPITAHAAAGRPILGTCAGMIVSTPSTWA